MNAFLEHWLTYKASWPGLMRIAAWSIFFLAIFGLALPPLPERMPLGMLTQGSPVIPMLTIIDDPRTVREDILPKPGALRIAWISDSSSVMIDQGKYYGSTPEDQYRLVPQRVAEKLKSRHDLPDFEMPLYLRLGVRSLDMLIFALLALQQKPDLIVIPINSIWTFSHYQVANRKTSMHLAPSVLVRYPQLWGIVAGFCSPAQNLWAFAGRHFTVIRYAALFKAFLLQEYGPLLDKISLASRGPEISLTIPATNIPYWIVMHLLKGNAKPVAKNKRIWPPLLYHQVIQHNDPYMTGSWATDGFHALLAILKASGIPAIIYNWPVSEEFDKNPATRKKLIELQEFLENEGQKLRGSNIKIISHMPGSVRKTMSFLDDQFHAAEEGKLDDFLAREIWLKLKEKTEKENR